MAMEKIKVTGVCTNEITKKVLKERNELKKELNQEKEKLKQLKKTIQKKAGSIVGSCNKL